MNNKISILHLEDVETDAELIQDKIKEDSPDFIFKTVDSRDDFVSALDLFKPDLVLSDFSVPGISGKIALDIVGQKQPDLPVIIVTGTLDEETAVELMKAGAADYILKDNLARLVPAVKNALDKKNIHKAKLTAEKNLRKSEELYRTLAESARDIIFVVNKDLKLEYINSYAVDLFGKKSSEIIGRKLADFFGNKIAKVQAEKIRQVITSKNALYLEHEIQHGNDPVWLGTTFTPIPDPQSSGITSVLGISRDITERIKNETTLKRRGAILQAIAWIAEKLVRSNSWQEQCSEMLQRVINTIDISRAFLYKKDTFEGDELRFSLIFEETAQGVSSLKDNPELKNLDLKELNLADWNNRYEKNQPVSGHATDIPSNIQKITTKSGIISFISLPIIIKKKLWGFIGFHETRKSRVWTEEEIEGLQILANTITAAISREFIETERKQLEEQLLQAQKLEGIGQLAGGIAHDFNNLLTIILGYCQILNEQMPEANTFKKHILEIQNAGSRAADLTNQLLAFSRKQIIEPKVLNPVESLTNIKKMLNRLIGENIVIQSLLDESTSNIKIDPGQFDQIIMNLAVNARDAMPNGGKLILETYNVKLEPSYEDYHLSVKPGEYVLISVSDSGQGMDAETKSRIFEPFYTTKEVGKGTGLGLSTVYGIVKQAEGNIWVYSEPDKGTTFKIYLPAVTENPDVFEKNNISSVKTGNETILIVEDEAGLRELLKSILKRYGYNIIVARDVEHALEITRNKDIFFSLLITDVVMPVMNGQELAVKINKVYPDVKVLFVTGYTDNIVVNQGIIKEGSNILTKPFSIESLVKKVREVLDNE
ncbi:MAG: response regulator [Calditrichae bacterium]|nr:response regulator [Calditrichota bacterium]MCB9058747.1 response regulator [Calditrichia bacterium]